MRRTKAEADATRESLLDAAEAVFLEKGVAETTLADIARAAGVTRGAIYWHFKDKCALFRAMQDRALLPQETFVADLDDGSSGSHLDRLFEAGERSVRHLADSERARRVITILMFRCEFVGEMGATLDRLRDGDCAMKAKVLDGLEAAMAAGELGPGWTAEDAKRAYCCSMTGTVTEWIRQDGSFDLVATDRTMRTALFEALRRPMPSKAD
jgi:AcrR family transcriptional regulator